MIIGVPKERKVKEHRVGIVPGGVHLLVEAGHRVLIETGAGLGVGIPDFAYVAAGAEVMPDAAATWGEAELVMKVKEPIKEEYQYLRDGLLLYTFLHLAAEKALTEELIRKKVTGIAYETIQLPDRSLPLLKPMSEVAGRMSVQIGAWCLEKHNGGKGTLLGGVPGVKRGRVTVIGGGAAGLNAAKMAVGLGAEVDILDVNPFRLAYLDDVFGNQVSTLMSNPENLAETVAKSDLVISAVLVTGAKAPCLVTQDMIASMEDGSVVVDIAIDQGGSVDGVVPTTHDDPVVDNNGVKVYAVTNIPGAVPKTSTYALTNVTLKYVLEIANAGFHAAVSNNTDLAKGVNTLHGYVTHSAVADAFGMSYHPVRDLL